MCVCVGGAVYTLILFVKEEIGEAGPKDIVASISAKVGGALGASASGQLPRNEMQISNAKHAIT